MCSGNGTIMYLFINNLKQNKMLNEQIVISVSPYRGSTSLDKNGKASVWLELLAGTMINRQVMTGTVAEMNGFEVGKTYLAKVRATGEDVDFQTAFTFSRTKELVSGTEIMETCKLVGPINLIILPKRADDYSYERKTNSVEGLNTIRSKEGKFQRFGVGATDHSNAKEVVKGSSADSDFNSGKTFDNSLPGEEDDKEEEQQTGRGKAA